MPCLVGDANSGKTSLSFPILSLVHHGNVATFTKQRAFNKSMITPFTEVIFLDEAKEATLDIDDWKTLTQGGYSEHDVKYQRAKSFINRCPMLITSQRRLNFGPSDQPAMDRRLRTYQFKSLAKPRKSASTWLKKHPMDCLIWATGKAKDARHRAPDDDEETEMEMDEERSFYEDGILRQSEKEALQVLSLDEEMDENTEQAAVEGQRSQDATEDSDSQSDPGQAGDVMLSLEERLRGLQPETLHHRQVMHMIQAERTKRSRAEKLRREQHERRKILLRNRGVSTQNAELVSSDPEEPIPSPVTRDLEHHRQAQKAAQEQARREAASKAFEGAWLQATEKELRECCDPFQASDDPAIRADMNTCMRVLSEKLKDHHMSLGTYGTAEALAEWKRVCTALGLLSVEQHHLVTSVSERLPVLEVQSTQSSGGGDADDDEDDDRIFITPTPSTRAPPMRQKGDWEISDELLRASCTTKRKRTSASQRTRKVPRNTITNYFWSASQN